MARVKGEIPSFINGVSQQAASVRLPTQGKVQTNLYDTLVSGKRKRPPSEVVCRIADAVPENAAFHIVDRDSTEKYIAVFSPTSVQVFDFQGNQLTVTTPNGLGYLASPDLRFLTVADYTLVVNRNVTAAMGTTRSPTRPFEAVINIAAGNYARTYEIRVNGAVVASVTTPDGSLPAHAAQVATTTIAINLYNQLVANLAAPWGVGIHQNALHILHPTTDFAISGVDGVNGAAMKISKDRVQRFSDLPQFGPHGFTIEVTSSAGNNFDNYWVRADKGGTNNNSVVTWRETLKPDTVLGLNAATMPHALVKNPDGSFKFVQLVWDQRKAGDETLSPNPSFVGQKIQDIFFHRNRLGLLADENVVMSRAGSFFDFFRTTATALLDDDPIDISASHIKVSFLKAAVPIAESLFLFSDRSQFRLSGNDLLTTRTANIRPIAEYTSSPRVRPIAIGNNIYFIGNDAGTTYTSLFEMAFDKRTEQVLSSEVTAHVPNYIPADVVQVAGTVDESVLVIRCASTPDTLIVYRYFWSGEEKVQSSFSKWHFPGVTILDCLFSDSTLYLLVNRDGRFVMEKVRMDTAATDTGLPFLIHLDGRVQAAGGTYDSVNNRTPFIVPMVDTRQAPTGVFLTGSRKLTSVPVTIGARNIVGQWTLWVSGNHTGAVMVFGTPYMSTYTLSQLFYRQTIGQGQRVVQDGRLQLLSFTLVHQDTSYFKVRLSFPDRPDTEIEFTGNILRDSLSVLGEIPVNSGVLTFPIESDSRRVEITLENDSWRPSAYLSGSWRGIWNSNSRSV